MGNVKVEVVPGRMVIEGGTPTVTVTTEGASLDIAKLSNDHYAAIGGVAAYWASFERALDYWLITFSELEHETGVCLASQIMGSRAKLEALIALLKHLGAPKKWDDPLDKFAVETVGLAERRNRAVHDVWDLRDPSKPMRKEESAKKRMRRLSIHVPTMKLRKLVERIQSHEQLLDCLCMDVMADLPSSRGKLRRGTTP